MRTRLHELREIASSLRRVRQEAQLKHAHVGALPVFPAAGLEVVHIPNYRTVLEGEPPTPSMPCPIANAPTSARLIARAWFPLMHKAAAIMLLSPDNALRLPRANSIRHSRTATGLTCYP